MTTLATPTTEDLIKLSPEEMERVLSDPSLPIETVEALAAEYLDLTGKDRMENQLTYYQPVSEDARKIHLALEHTVGAFGGNGSSKTDSMLVEMIILGTGIVPDSLADVYPRQKIKAPGRYRIVVESLTTTLYPVILPKLQWWKWDGIDDPGGKRGHWGWVPRSMLIGGEWDKSWNDKLRILTLLNGSIYHFMSFDQDPSDFESGRFHAILHDEPPPKAIWDTNITRVAMWNGTMYLSMTPPAEAGGINVGWIFDQIYEAGDEGSPHKNPDILQVTLFAEHNPHGDVEGIMKRADSMTLEKREVFLYGKFLHLSNLIHPLFSDKVQTWCFYCKTRIVELVDGACKKCGNHEVGFYCHVEDFEYKPIWPVVFVLDPHPRKPHMMQWKAVDPLDDFYTVAELQVDGETEDVAREVQDLESDMGLNVQMRIIDPNMGQSPSGKMRGIRWVEDFENAGLWCDLGDDNFEVGKERINNLLKPDERTRRPRMIWHPRCTKAIHQYKRYVFGEWKRYTDEDKDPKAKAKDKEDDYPTMDRYFVNANPTFDMLKNRKVVQKLWRGRK